MQSMTPVTGPEQPIYVVLYVQYESKKGDKYQELIKSGTTPAPGYQMRKLQLHNLTPQTKVKRSAFSQQVITRRKHDKHNTEIIQMKYRLGTVSKSIL